MTETNPTPPPADDAVEADTPEQTTDGWKFDRTIPRTIVLTQANDGTGGHHAWLEGRRLPHRVTSAYAGVDSGGMPVATLTLDLATWGYDYQGGRARVLADGQELPHMAADPAPDARFSGGRVAATVHLLAERVMTALGDGRIVVDVHHSGMSEQSVGNVMDLGLPVDILTAGHPDSTYTGPEDDEQS